MSLRETFKSQAIEVATCTGAGFVFRDGKRGKVGRICLIFFDRGSEASLERPFAQPSCQSGAWTKLRSFESLFSCTKAGSSVQTMQMFDGTTTKQSAKLLMAPYATPLIHHDKTHGNKAFGLWLSEVTLPFSEPWEGVSAVKE